MALWICKACTAAYAVGMPACPQCGGTEYTPNTELETTAMPKISKVGPSYEGHDPGDIEQVEAHEAPATETAQTSEPQSAAAAPATPPEPPPAPAPTK